MVTPETEISTNIEPSKKMEEIVYHKLQYKWTLWAHLPQDSDWTKNSYKPIFTFTNVEELIDTMSVEQSYYIITEAIHMAYSKKIFSLQESEILSKALRTIKSSTFEK
jgi:hypothetical protein